MHALHACEYASTFLVKGDLDDLDAVVVGPADGQGLARGVEVGVDEAGVGVAVVDGLGEVDLLVGGPGALGLGGEPDVYRGKVCGEKGGFTVSHLRIIGGEGGGPRWRGETY